jgi:septal ring factor EnvC (AmiA/AmiB activator)
MARAPQKLPLPDLKKIKKNISKSFEARKVLKESNKELKKIDKKLSDLEKEISKLED